jgi:sulfopyruvate decarboxylase subunit alpha
MSRSTPVAASTRTRLAENIVAAGFTLVTGVPDSPLAELADALERMERHDYYRPGAREDACLAFAAGAALAGARPLVFMKSAGFGSCVDVLTSLVQVYRIPTVLLVSWAGHAGRDVPHHNVIGEPLEALALALGIPVRQAPMSDPDALGTALRAAACDARELGGAAAVFGIPEGL